jgi:hypothetical protein
VKEAAVDLQRLVPPDVVGAREPRVIERGIQARHDYPRGIEARLGVDPAKDGFAEGSGHISDVRNLVVVTAKQAKGARVSGDAAS